MKETPRSNARRRAHGFSTAWRQGEDTEAYRSRYDDIFRKKGPEPLEPIPKHGEKIPNPFERKLSDEERERVSESSLIKMLAGTGTPEETESRNQGFMDWFEENRDRLLADRSEARAERKEGTEP
jgi:hypothetical protein